MIACSLFLMMVCTPLLAQNYTRSGTAHLPTANYGPYTAYQIAPNVAEIQMFITVINRSDQPLTASIDFYEMDGTKVVTGASLPAPWADGVVPAHTAVRFQTNSLPELSSYTDTSLTPVIVFTGAYATKPKVLIEQQALDASDNLLTETKQILCTE
jgi:hypothetical protein